MRHHSLQLEQFPRDPVNTLGHRVSNALLDILEHELQPDDRVSDIWPNGPDNTDPYKIDFIIIPQHGMCLQ